MTKCFAMVLVAGIAYGQATAPPAYKEVPLTGESKTAVQEAIDCLKGAGETGGNVKDASSKAAKAMGLTVHRPVCPAEMAIDRPIDLSLKPRQNFRAILRIAAGRFALSVD
mgnify:CR=1 FL=1